MSSRVMGHTNSFGGPSVGLVACMDGDDCVVGNGAAGAGLD